MHRIGSYRDARTGAVVGTMDYMSPEQLGGVGPVDGRSDVFSLGCVVYEMVTGRRPFTRGGGASPSREPALPLRDLRRDVPPHFAHAVGRAMDPDPDRRYATAGAFAGALSSTFASTGGATAMTGPQYRRRVWVGAIMVVIVIGVLVILL